MLPSMDQAQQKGMGADFSAVTLQTGILCLRAGEGRFALWLWTLTAEASCFSFSSPSMDRNFPVKLVREVHDFFFGG